VLALYYQLGLGHTALESGLAVTSYPLGSAVAASLAGRVVTRVGRPVVVLPAAPARDAHPPQARAVGLGAPAASVLVDLAGIHAARRMATESHSRPLDTPLA
jgi:MFS family permease